MQQVFDAAPVMPIPGVPRNQPAAAVEVSLVVPMYNELESAGVFFEKVVPIMASVTKDFEIICVNDGSTDGTLELLREWRDREPRIRVVDLSRNFGKEPALTAGIDHARGHAVIPIDADLQDPPEMIPEMVDKWREGYDMVLALRSDRESDSWVKRTTARMFYRLMGGIAEVPIPENVGDFRLMDRRVVEALARMPERTRFMKGLFAWLGFRQAVIPYARQPGSAGTSKWRYWRLWNFAIEGIASFTTWPLRVWTYLGFGCSIFAMGYLIMLIIKTLIIGSDVPGYASLLSVILFFNGLTMIGLGIIGEYLGRVFLEVKRRPLYLVREAIGFEPPKSVMQDAALTGGASAERLG